MQQNDLAQLDLCLLTSKTAAARLQLLLLGNGPSQTILGCMPLSMPEPWLCWLQALLVACSEGWVHWLSPATGEQLASLHLGSGIISAPVLDPWQGLVWVATHAALVALDAAGKPRQPGGCSACLPQQCSMRP